METIGSRLGENAQSAKVFKAVSRWRLVHNLVILAVGEVLSKGLAFIAFVHLARVLEPAAYGLVELTLALMMFLRLMVDQGLGTLGAREVARGSSSAELLVGRIVSTQLITAATIFVLLVAVVLCLPMDLALKKLLLGYGVSLLGIPLLLNWFFQGRNQMFWVAVPQVIHWATFGSLVLVMIHRPGDVQLLPIAEIVALAFAVTISLSALKRSGDRLSINFLAGYDRRLLAQSLPIGGSQIIWALRMYLPIILLGFLVDRDAVGFFGAAHRVVMVFQASLSLYFMNLFPSMSQAAHNSPSDLAKLLHRSLWLAAWPSLVLALGCTLLAPSILKEIYGELYTRPEAIAILAVLIWIIPVLVWRGHGRNALFTLNRQREELGCSLAGLLLLLALGVPLSHTYGGLGFAWGMLGSELAATVLMWWRLKPHMALCRG